MQKVNVGLLGLGTVGTGVAKVLLERSAWFARRAGVPITLKRIAPRHPARQPAVRLKAGLVTSDARAILRDPDIQVVVELIGGIHPAREYVLEAIRAGKHVVTANKALLRSEERRVGKERR